jgi:hypothetical protein
VPEACCLSASARDWRATARLKNPRHRPTQSEEPQAPARSTAYGNPTMTHIAARAQRLALLLALLQTLSCGAVAATVTYPDAGTENPTTYDFVAASAGDLLAYFVGRGDAVFSDTLGVTVDGVTRATTGLNNQVSVYGETLDLGHVNAGDQIVFSLAVANIGATWYSDASLNSDGANHAYAAPFTGNSLIPRGTYVGFEDLPAAVADFNYTDEQFVVSNIRTVPSAVPVPASGWLLMGGLAGLGLFGRRRPA